MCVSVCVCECECECVYATMILKAANLLSAGGHVQGQIQQHTCYWNKSNTDHQPILGPSLTCPSYSCVLGKGRGAIDWRVCVCGGGGK